jgi:long-chain acyl-CoA synthetase
MSLEQHPNTLWDLLQQLIFHPERQDYLSSWVNGEKTSLSSTQFAQHVLQISLGLSKSIAPGERIGLMGASSPLWMACDLAIMGAGGITVPLFPSMAPSILKDEVKQANVQRIFYLDQNAILDWDGLFFQNVYSPSHLKTEAPQQSNIQDLELPVQSQQDELQKCWASLQNNVKKDQVATILFTSGSTGKPKGIPLTHENLISQVLGAAERFSLRSDTDSAFSFLPLAHIFERMVIFYYLHKHIPITFCDNITRIGERMKEAQPTIMTTVPRLLEKVQNSMSQRTLSKPSPSKEIGRWALTMALTQPLNKDWPLLSWFVADQLVYKKFREALGGKLNTLIVGGAPLSPRLARFYNNIGIPTYQGYGLSESSPVIALNYPEHNREGRVGKAFPGVQIHIDPMSQEICAKGPGIMKGYIEDENVVDQDGWLHTGDLGEIDSEGYLNITGRKKEMFKTSNGKYVCPVPIEDEICSHPWVDQSIVIAEGRSYVIALLTPDLDAMPSELLAWVKSGHAPPEHHPLRLEEHLQTINEKLNPWEKVQKVAWLKSTLSIEENDLTPTMKIKRHVIDKKYVDFIESLYNKTL